jgi:hypothetical protein
MVAVPEAIPETNPVAESTVATNASLVLHEPPATVEANVVVPLVQIFCNPESVPAFGGAIMFKLNVWLIAQLVPTDTVYTTVTVPAVPPVKTPPTVIVAVPVPLVTDQVPPGNPFKKASEPNPAHVLIAPPVIGGKTGKDTTDNDFVTLVEQPFVLLVTVYSTITVPAVKPETTPDPSIVAAPVPLAIDHTPPTVVLVKAAVVEPVHTTAEPPEIAATTGDNLSSVTITLSVSVQPLADVTVTVKVPAVLTTKAAVVPTTVLPSDQE